MSYCVNCGVELDASAEECALCNTPVYHPKELQRERKHPPFPTEKGQVETVKRKDFAILVSAVLLAIAITCGLLNGIFFKESLWSLAVIGACGLLWVLLIPVIISVRQTVYLSLFLDGVAVVVYLYMLTVMIGRDKWFWGLGLEITVFVTILAELVALAYKKLPRSFLISSLYFFTTTALLCVGVEVLIDRYLGKKAFFGWSAVVATVCIIMDIALVTMLSLRRLRNAVRRRLHF